MAGAKSLDEELPKRDKNHVLEDISESRLTSALQETSLFVAQGSERKDYGTDLQLEVIDNGLATNVRVHVQLKSTRARLNADGSVSRKVARANLNYLLVHPNSIYVCLHVPTDTLFVRYADEVHSEHQRDRPTRGTGKHLTVRLRQRFDEAFQKELHARALAASRAARDERLAWQSTPPEKLAARVTGHVPSIEVPHDPEAALAVLERLSDEGQDEAISLAFEKFGAALGGVPGSMDRAYMAEINLALGSHGFSGPRVEAGIAALSDSVTQGRLREDSGLYCIGNGWNALGRYDQARASYERAMELLLANGNRQVAAMCCANLGSVLAALGETAMSHASYERALELDPDLGEAHLALALRHLRHGDDPQLAIHHLDLVMTHSGSSVDIASVQGWRLQALFRSGDARAAFREIQSLVGQADRYPWIWPWCARQVGEFGRTLTGSEGDAARFWKGYLREGRNGQRENAEREYLWCLSRAHVADESAASFEEFARLAATVAGRDGEEERALIWDKVGHWAEDEGRREEAEAAFRKAYELEPESYGYCLGSALLSLERYDEALPILTLEAEELQPNARSWMKLAKARKGVGDIEGSVVAYGKAIEKDPDCVEAWFERGGVLWNSGDWIRGLTAWKEALSRFPEHDLAKKLREGLPQFFARDAPESAEE